jgi:hypothetical protein
MRIPHSIPVVLLASAIAAVAALPGREPTATVPADPLARQIAAAEWRYRLQSQFLRRAESRELARQAAGAAVRRPGGGDQVIRHEPVPAEFETYAAALLEEHMRRRPRREPSVRVVLVLAPDGDTVVAGVKVARLGDWISLDAFPPLAPTDSACVVVARLRTRSLGGGNRRTVVPAFASALNAAVGSCDWFAAYGRPGAGIAAWLDSTSFAAVRGADPLLHQRRAMSAGSWTARLWNGRTEALSVRCARGATAVCSSLVLERPQLAGQAYTLRATGMISDLRYIPYVGSPPSANFLPWLAHDLGPDAFSRVWQSDASLEAAVAAVAGEPLGDLVRRQIAGAMPAIQGEEYRASALPRPFHTMLYLFALAVAVRIGAQAVGRRGTFA